ncbi:MAG: lasso peptide biosynthesis B2 protein [Solirubrobacterales bacterium]
MRRLPPGRSLRTGERARLAAEIVAAYLLARREMRRAPIEQAVARLRDGSVASSGASSGEEVAEARRVGRAVVRTLRFLPGDTRCLRRSLVTLRLLARRGIGVQLVIGARSDPDFLAHAWVEYRGEPVLSPLDGDGTFGRLVEI